MKPWSLVTSLALLALFAMPATGFGEEEGESPREDPLTKIFGDGGMELKCQRMESTMGEQSGELEYMRMRGGVDIKSEQMDLKCDELDIDMKKQKMVAKGKIVRFVQSEVEGTCGRLEYDIETGKTVLTGTPKPMIVQKDANGRITETSANTITIIQTEGGRRDIYWEGDTEFKVQPTNGAATNGNDDATTKTRKTARERKVTPTNVGDLKSPSVPK